MSNMCLRDGWPVVICRLINGFEERSTRSSRTNSFSGGTYEEMCGSGYCNFSDVPIGG